MTQWLPGAAGMVVAVVVLVLASGLGASDWLLVPAMVAGYVLGAGLWATSPLQNNNISR